MQITFNLKESTSCLFKSSTHTPRTRLLNLWTQVGKGVGMKEPSVILFY